MMAHWIPLDDFLNTGPVKCASEEEDMRSVPPVEEVHLVQ